MPQNLLRRTQLTFIWVALIPMVLAALAWWLSVQYRLRVHWVSHTQQMLSRMNDLVQAVTNAETGERGYLLTGDESYLGPFNEAQPQVDECMARLRELVRDSGPLQKERLDELAPVVRDKMDELRRTVELRRREGADAAIAEVRTGTGRRAMEKILRISLTISNEEERELTDRLKAQQQSETGAAACFGAGILMSTGLLFWAYHLIVGYADERKRAEMEALRLNAELERRVAERTEELRAANTNLQRSNADLERFASVASHDLQEPLRMVSAYMDLLARRYEGKLDQDADDYIRFAVDGAGRMRLLITDLLAYSRCGTQAVSMAPTDFGKVLEVAMENLGVLREESGAEIVHGPLPVVAGDEASLVLVMQNLIGNAIKFRKPEVRPKVRVAAARVDGEWRFVVEDNGIGFEGRYAERIFEIFQRLHSTGTYPGTGMGLAIAKRIIEAHGGRMWAESVVGEGSKFWFALPAKA